MLCSLHIRNYVLIDSLDVSFPEGLVIITGQTGAGKSILLGALSLLMGAKADASVIGEGGDSCVVEAEFSVDGQEAVRELLESSDLEWDNGHLLVRRVVNESGRSRSFINDEPVQVSLLGELSSHLIDIHSQHSSLLLANKGFQMAALDYFAGDGPEKKDCAAAWKKVQVLRSQLREVEQKLERLSAEKSYNESQFARLEAAKLKEGEMAELETEQKLLAGSEQILEALAGARELLSPSNEDFASPLASLKEASRLLERIGSLVPAAGELAGRLESARIELDDVLGEIVSLQMRSDASPERLQAVDDRISLLYDLMKLHGVQDADELIGIRDSLGELLFDTGALVERKEELSKELTKAQAELEDCARRLHGKRAGAAPGLSAQIQEAVRSLELEKAVFEVSLSEAPLGPDGADAVSFAFSATGRVPLDVSKCASGGEVSRIMLCLKALMAKYTNMPTMIFDEIDTGVSGSAADKMGSMICDMGADMQVFAITHLPQVAAKGSAHYLVTKSAGASGASAGASGASAGAGRVVSDIRKLSPEERVGEIARMLSGSTITPEAIANARALLG